MASIGIADKITLDKVAQNCEDIYAKIEHGIYPEPTGKKTIIENGNDIDVKNFASVDVNVPTVELGTLDVTENGSYEAESGKGYNKVNVEVETYPEPSGTTTITTNGTHDVKDFATAEVNVPEREINLQNKTATENGTYSADEGYDGIGEITVNVEGGQGEGYTVSSIDNGDGTQTLQIDDGFFPTETMLIESNGEYDVAKYGKVEVDVKGGGIEIPAFTETIETVTVGANTITNALDAFNYFGGTSKLTIIVCKSQPTLALDSLIYMSNTSLPAVGGTVNGVCIRRKSTGWTKAIIASNYDAILEEGSVWEVHRYD